jgi:hypothetical protein
MKLFQENGLRKGGLPPTSFREPPRIHLSHVSHPYDAYHKSFHCSRHLRGQYGCSVHELLKLVEEVKKLRNEKVDRKLRGSSDDASTAEKTHRFLTYHQSEFTMTQARRD